MADRAEFSLQAGTPKRPLRVLIVEDTPADAELVIAALKQAGYSTFLEVVVSPEEFEQKLAGPGYDIILADYNLRTWTAIDALEILRRVGKEIPLVVVTGALGDEAAAECIKQGAMDYVLKDRMARLPSAVERALKEKRLRDERKRAEAQLRKLSSVVEQTADPVIITSAYGTIEYVNPAFEIGTGFPAHEAIGQTMRINKSGVHPPEFFREFWAKLLSGRPWWGTFVNRRKNGEIYFAEATVNPIFSAEGKITHFVSVQKDVTRMKRAEEALRESEEQFRLIAENVADLIAVLDLEGRRLYNSPSYKAILGEPDAMRGTLSFDEIHPEDREKIKQVFQETVRTGRGQQAEFRFLLPNGSVRFIESQGSVIRDEAGKAIRVLVVSRDVTERKQLRDQLLQSQKMEAVGRLAGGVAHDFNNLLTVINGYSELLLGKLLPDDPQRGNLEEILKAGERAAVLTRQLLAFSRRQVMVPRVLDLNVVIGNMEKMLQRLIGEDIELVAIERPDLGHVLADPGQIEQVIMNLAVNARDAMPAGGKLTLETANVEINEAYTHTHFTVVPGAYVMLAVSDTGCGMDEEAQRHIFEPFFTTKVKGKGTGLGLATVYGIVKQSRGSIWVYSEPGKGATFKIYLPQVKEAIGTAAASQAPLHTLRGSETILLVEDEEAVRALAARILQGLGYKVLESTSPEDAVQIGEGHKEPIDLLLTDVVMPGMSGRNVAEHLAFLRPKMKVLYMSGYTDNAIVHHGVLEAGTAFLQKPFSSAALAQKVRQVLGE